MRVERGATVGAALPGIEFPINAATSATQRSTDQIIIKLESNKRKTEIKKKIQSKSKSKSSVWLSFEISDKKEERDGRDYVVRATTAGARHGRHSNSIEFEAKIGAKKTSATAERCIRETGVDRWRHHGQFLSPMKTRHGNKSIKSTRTPTT